MMFASNPHPMWVYDTETLRFLEVNSAAVAQYGYTREEFLELEITAIRPPEEAGRLLASRPEMPQPVRHAGIWRHCRKDGGIILAEITTHELDSAAAPGSGAGQRRHGAGTVGGSAPFQRAAFRALIEQSSEGICLLDRDGRISYEAPTVTRLLGFDPENGSASRRAIRAARRSRLLDRAGED